MYQPHLTSWSRVLVLVSAWWQRPSVGRTRAGVAHLNAMKSSVYSKAPVTNSQSSHTDSMEPPKDSFFLAWNCILHSQYNTCCRISFSKQVSTGLIAWGVGVGVQKLQYLISTTAKFTVVRPLSSKVSHGEAAGRGCSIPQSTYLIFGHSK